MFTLLFSIILISSAECAVNLKLLNDYNLPTMVNFQNSQMGGLSGLAYDEKNKSLLAISDDRGERSDFRFYQLNHQYVAGQGKVSAQSVTYLKDFDSSPYPMSTLDPEGIALTQEGQVFISFEGILDEVSNEIIPPSVMLFNREGIQLGQLKIPTDFIPNSTGPNQTKGVRNNQGFEGLAIDHESGHLIVATEGPLAQDGLPANFLIGSRNRILRYSGDGAVEQYIYPVDAEERIIQDPGAVGENLISEILSIGDGKYLVMERGSNASKSEGFLLTVKIYETSFEGATEVSAVEDINDDRVQPMRKKLVLDLNSIAKDFSPGFQTVDNLEGMALGPRLENGLQTLVMVSDSNFRPNQRTQFLFFTIEH